MTNNNKFNNQVFKPPYNTQFVTVEQCRFLRLIKKTPEMYDSFILGHNYTIGEIKNRTDEKLPTFGIEKIFICINSDTIF